MSVRRSGGKHTKRDRKWQFQQRNILKAPPVFCLNKGEKMQEFIAIDFETANPKRIRKPSKPFSWVGNRVGTLLFYPII